MQAFSIRQLKCRSQAPGTPHHRHCCRVGAGQGTKSDSQPGTGWLLLPPVAGTRKGYDDLIVWSEEFGSKPVYAIEGTSSYGAGLTRELQDAGFPVVEVNRTDRFVRRRLGKDVDAVFREAVAIDAEAAARAYLAGTATATPKTGADQVEMIRML
jgi:transposase